MEAALGKLAVGIILLLILLLVIFFQRETEEQRRKRLEEEKRREEERLERERKEADARKEFDQFVSQGMPASVAKGHSGFRSENPLQIGQTWYGEDVSPLTYYGYRVGKTRGLRKSERCEIIYYVMRVRLTDPLALSYQSSWGAPLSSRRRQAIISHINKLAAQRSSRRGYEVAVAEWSEDSKWTENVMRDEATRLGGYGFE